MSEQSTPWQVGEQRGGTFDVTCPNWLAFMAYVDKRHKNAHGRFYRGQREADWPIESRLLRETRAQLQLQFPDWTPDRIDYVAGRTVLSDGGNVMQSYSSHFAQRDGTALSDLQSWMVGRHQGLFTPFVDWSRSPYVAAFFAAVDVVEKRLQNGSGLFAVYAVNSWLFPFGLSKESSDHGELPRYALKVDAAFSGNPRGIAQRAVATYIFPQTDVGQFVAVAASQSELHAKSLERIVLPHACAVDALIHMNRMNINYVSLFPDAEGLAKQANLNLLMPDYEGTGNWSRPPGFDLLIPEESEFDD